MWKMNKNFFSNFPCIIFFYSLSFLYTYPTISFPFVTPSTPVLNRLWKKKKKTTSHVSTFIFSRFSRCCQWFHSIVPKKKKNIEERKNSLLHCSKKFYEFFKLFLFFFQLFPIRCDIEKKNKKFSNVIWKLLWNGKVFFFFLIAHMLVFSSLNKFFLASVECIFFFFTYFGLVVWENSKRKRNII